jgi:hypothetical protein
MNTNIKQEIAIHTQVAKMLHLDTTTQATLFCPEIAAQIYNWANMSVAQMVYTVNNFAFAKELWDWANYQFETQVEMVSRFNATGEYP